MRRLGALPLMQSIDWLMVVGRVGQGAWTSRVSMYLHTCICVIRGPCRHQGSSMGPRPLGPFRQPCWSRELSPVLYCDSVSQLRRERLVGQAAVGFDHSSRQGDCVGRGGGGRNHPRDPAGPMLGLWPVPRERSKPLPPLRSRLGKADASWQPLGDELAEAWRCSVLVLIPCTRGLVL